MADDVSIALHVDLSAAMVHVINLLRFRGRNGDFYIFNKRISNFSFAAYDLCVKFNFLADSAGRNNLLLHDVALSVSRVTNGDLFNELARVD